MSGVIWPEVGDGVWWTNRRGGKLRGICEIHRKHTERVAHNSGLVETYRQAGWIGVRLENGNFRWATSDECSPRDMPNNDVSGRR